ncbi:MAG: MFS transporter [Microcella sp.]|uniref:MFS transporter n=1 Tax=Microcella sp. TaxID=1913979 RepID=UPI00271D0922|nr:MFS transporter [Microcella sp.]MDO8338919.1 MFS transporter [Microcella sp.]
MTTMERAMTGAGANGGADGTRGRGAGDARESAATSAARRARLLVPSVVAAMVLLSSASFVIFPLIPALQGSLGVSTAEVGYLAAAGFAAALVAELLVAPAADRGHARLMAVIGVLMVAGSLGLSAAAAEGWQLIAGRAVGGFGFGIFVIAASALIVRHDHRRSGELLGRLGAAELAGIAVGPLGSGLALSFAGPSAILAVSAVVVLVALVPVLVGFREATASGTRGGARGGHGHPRTGDCDATRGATDGTEPIGDDPHPPTGGIAAGVLGFDGTDADRSLRFGSSAPRTSLDLLRSPRIVGIVLLYAAVMVPTGAYDGVWPRFMADIGADPVLTALSYALFAVPYVLVAGWAGRLADRRGGVSAYARGMLILLPIVTLYGFVANPFIATGMGFVESTGQALAFIGAAAAMAHAVDPARAGSAQGLLRGIGLAAATVAAAVSGLAYELGGALLLFGGTAVAVAAIAAVGLLLARTRRAR